MTAKKLKILKGENHVTLETVEGYDYLFFSFDENKQQPFSFHFSTISPSGSCHFSMFKTGDVNNILTEIDYVKSDLFLLLVVLNSESVEVVHQIEIEKDRKEDAMLILEFFREMQKISLTKGFQFSFDHQAWLDQLDF